MVRPKVLVVDDNQELLDVLSRLFIDAGYQALSATKGRPALELARAEKPALAVVDVLLPDMMGHHLADALRRELSVPVIFLTGVFKGGKHAAEAKAKYGSVAYFEKPFDARLLLESARALVPPGLPEPSGEVSFEVEVDVDIDEDRAQDPMELTGVIRVTGDLVRAELAGVGLTVEAARPGGAALLRPPPADYPSAPLPVRESERGIRRGDLRDNLPSLINAFYLSQESGQLGVQRGKVKKAVYFDRGRPVFALSNLVTDRLGQFLVRVGKIDEAQLKQATATAAASKRRTGEVLQEMGLLQETERLYYVAQQVKTIIYSLFGWEDGIYEIAFHTRARAERIKLDIHPANLIVRGVKKLYRPERLRRLLALDERVIPSMQPAYGLHEVSLEKWEAQLLPKADGTRTVAELIALANRPESVVLGFLYGLVALSILERRA